MTFGVSRFRRLLPVACLSLAVTNLADIVDVTIAGRILGESALAAIQLVWPLVEFIFFIGTMIASGTSTFYFMSIGAFDKRRASQWFSNGLLIAVASGMAMVALMFIGRDAFFAYFGISEETYGYVLPYWNWFSLQVLLSPLNIFLAALVCADGDTRTATAAFCVEFGVNAVLSFFLCNAMGTAGCALGTVCGTVTGMIVLMTHFFRESNSFRFCLHFSPRDSWRLLSTGFPSSSTVLFTAFVFMLMNKILAGKFGDDGLGIMSVVSISCNLMLFLYGIPNAVQPIVCLYLGEKNYPVARNVIRDALWVAAWMGTMLSVSLIAMPWLPGWVIGVTSAELGALSSHAVRIVAGSFVFTGLGTLILSYYQYSGHPGYSMLLTLLQELVLPTAGCVLGIFAFGYNGFLVGYALAPALAMLIVFATICIRSRRIVDPLLLPKVTADKLNNWNIVVDEASVCRVASEIHETLESAGMPIKVSVRADMLVEDSLMMIKDRNPKRKVLAEVTLDMRDGVKLVFSDDGTTSSKMVDSGDTWFRAQTLGAVVKTVSDRNGAVASGFNRNEYVLLDNKTDNPQQETVK